jgi:GntR family transcriptional regulator of arabinose operon
MNKSLQVKEILGKHISRQRLARKFRLPPERELAKQLGYSRATVSKALGVLEGEGVILRKKGSGTFIAPSQQEQALKIAVVIRTAYHYTDAHFRLIVEEVLKYAEKNNICIQIFDHATDVFKNDPDNNPLMRAIKNKEIDGVLIASKISIDILNRISSRCPTVLINNMLSGGSEIPCISCNYFLAGFLAGRYLFEHGHRKVAYVTDNHNAGSVFGFSGFKAALDLCGVKVTKHDVLETKQHLNIFNKRIVNFFKNSGYTACFFRRISYVSRMISTLEHNDIKVPEDLSIITIGNYSNCQLNKLKLTVIDNQLSKMCDLGLKKLKDMIKNDKRPEGDVTLLTPEIIENDSVIKLNHDISKKVKG